MYLYGILIGHLVAAFISLSLAYFVYYGCKYINQHEQPWETNPRYSKQSADTSAALARQSCESANCFSDHRFYAKNTKPDSEI